MAAEARSWRRAHEEQSSAGPRAQRLPSREGESELVRGLGYPSDNPNFFYMRRLEMPTIEFDEWSRFTPIRILWVMGQTCRVGLVARLMGHALVGLAADIELWAES